MNDSFEELKVMFAFQILLTFLYIPLLVLIEDFFRVTLMTIIYVCSCALFDLYYVEKVA